MQESLLLFFKNISNPVLDIIAESITMLGEQYFFIAVISFLFWNISKREGFKLSVAFIYSTMLNAVLKITFHTQRPFEKLDYIKGKRVQTATGYSFPSGHTQGTTTFFITLSKIVKKRWFTLCSVVILLLVGISRIYLGVHWPVDVIAAIILGLAMSLLFCSIVDRYYDDYQQLKKIFLRIQFVSICLTIILLLIDFFFLKGSMKIQDFFKISGVATGAVYGFFLEESYIDFSATKGSRIKKIIRFLLGISLAAVIMAGLKIFLPKHDLFNYLRYAIVGLWITFLWPALGIKTNLFEKNK